MPIGAVTRIFLALLIVAFLQKIDGGHASIRNFACTAMDDPGGDAAGLVFVCMAPSEVAAAEPRDQDILAVGEDLPVLGRMKKQRLPKWLMRAGPGLARSPGSGPNRSFRRSRPLARREPMAASRNSRPRTSTLPRSWLPSRWSATSTVMKTSAVIGCSPRLSMVTPSSAGRSRTVSPSTHPSGHLRWT